MLATHGFIASITEKAKTSGGIMKSFDPVLIMRQDEKIGCVTIVFNRWTAMACKFESANALHCKWMLALFENLQATFLALFNVQQMKVQCFAKVAQMWSTFNVKVWNKVPLAWVNHAMPILIFI